MSFCTNYGTINGTNLIDVTAVTIPPGAGSQIRIYVDYLINIYNGKQINSFNYQNSIVIQITFSDAENRNNFIEDVNKTIETGKLASINANEVNNLSNMVLDFFKIMDGLNPFLDLVKNNGGIDNAKSSCAEFEKARMEGTLSPEVLDAKKCFETFMEEYLIGRTFMEKN